MLESVEFSMYLPQIAVELTAGASGVGARDQGASTPAGEISSPNMLEVNLFCVSFPCFLFNRFFLSQSLCSMCHT